MSAQTRCSSSTTTLTFPSTASCGSGFWGAVAGEPALRLSHRPGNGMLRAGRGTACSPDPPQQPAQARPDRLPDWNIRLVSPGDARLPGEDPSWLATGRGRAGLRDDVHRALGLHRRRFDLLPGE